jgi:hypothetical protein
MWFVVLTVFTGEALLKTVMSVGEMDRDEAVVLSFVFFD